MKHSILFFLMLAASEVSNAQSWLADVTNDGNGIYAATLNDEGNVFGQFCYLDIGSCLWTMTLKTRCRDGAKYPTLINSESGAFHVTIMCDGELPNPRDGFRYIFLDFEIVDSAVRESRQIGIAMPLETNQFRVSRFDLRGSIPVIEKMRAKVLELNRKGSKNTRDVVL